MKITTKEVKEFSFREDEMIIIRLCLNYAVHRLDNHERTGIENALHTADNVAILYRLKRSLK